MPLWNRPSAGKRRIWNGLCPTRLDDGFQVALKFVSNRNKKFFLIDGYSKPLPLEVALLILASQDPPVPEIVELLDWDVEPDHYILVLERPMSFVELNWFVLRQIMSLEEDVAGSSCGRQYVQLSRAADVEYCTGILRWKTS
ncbi:serine threonine- kinase pim-2-like protein [Labeo rohita]|nr:serine threonine- kinase pim-2-like protein [Labeo rohita]